MTADDVRACPKCGAVSGDDWKQCEGSCPMPGSPHYDDRVDIMLNGIPIPSLTEVRDDARARFEAWVATRAPHVRKEPIVEVAFDAGYRAAHADRDAEVRELVRASQAMLDGLAVAEPAKRSLFQELRAAIAKFTHQEKEHGA